ncbi:MAG: class A beta-lactamase-related serine hydrolase [Defluviitaleaceae bacterium]|nr:class A beta-lactamase-related serine hydrolase [Defluviitaleaceae bacterium]MCL2262369.1 class A beta-lactamase-related serine hydrolase [Defluviitaleaceae bacterium]
MIAILRQNLRVLAVFFAVFFAVFILCVPVRAEGLYHIPHEFELYESACFGAGVVGRFGAQDIEILAWGEGYWVRTEIEGQAGWVNLRYSPAMCALDAFFAPLGWNVSVFYKNLETGFTYIHNPERVFFAASLSKSTHALYTFKLAERGYIDMYEVHVYSPRDEWGGTGVLRFWPFGVELTTRDLLGLSMRESDNAAFRMLVRMTDDAAFSYRDFVREIGADTRLIRDILAQNTSARDKGLFMTEIFNYIENPSRFGHYLKYDMLNTAQTSHPHFTRWEGSNGWGDNGVGTDVNVRMLRSDYPLARKYGWAGGAFHDAGIIYAPSPYILVILSNMERGAHEMFERVSWFVQDFNNNTFVAPVMLNAPQKGPQVCDAIRVVGRRGGFRLTIPVFAEETDRATALFQPVKLNAADRKILFKNTLIRGCADK